MEELLHYLCWKRDRKSMIMSVGYARGIIFFRKKYLGVRVTSKCLFTLLMVSGCGCMENTISRSGCAGGRKLSSKGKVRIGVTYSQLIISFNIYGIGPKLPINEEQPDIFRS